MPSCRCVRGDCLRCSCSVAGRVCSPNCTCGTLRPCTNTPVVNVSLNPTGQVTMANQALIDALTALTGQMMMNQQAQVQAQQQLHDDMAAQAAAIQQQQQAHQALLAQLANPPVAPPALGPRTAAVGLIPVFSGNAIDSLADWLSILNRTSVAEGWNDDVKRQVAIGKLSGSALQWHDLSGSQHATWIPWLAALEATFRPRLSLVEWCSQIERRVQLPGESGAQYALEKVKLCRLCPHQLPDADVINYLSKGLIMPDQRAILLANPPADFDAFITRIRALESVGSGLTNAIQPPTPHPVTTPVAAYTVTSAAGELASVLKGFGDQITQSVREMRSMVQPTWRHTFNGGRPTTPFPSNPPSGPQLNASQRPMFDGGFGFRPRRPVSEITCFNCLLKGHFAKDCAQPQRTQAGPIVANYTMSENEMAGPWGQDRPNY